MRYVDENSRSKKKLIIFDNIPPSMTGMNWSISKE
jgi:hypothetical protein